MNIFIFCEQASQEMIPDGEMSFRFVTVIPGMPYECKNSDEIQIQQEEDSGVIKSGESDKVNNKIENAEQIETTVLADQIETKLEGFRPDTTRTDTIIGIAE